MAGVVVALGFVEKEVVTGKLMFMVKLEVGEISRWGSCM